MNHKSLTLIIPVFNNGQLLNAAINSVQKQNTYQITDWSLELIVVNDASTDTDTVQILDSLPSTIGSFKVKVFHNKFSLGAGGARNIGILHSSGRWVAFLDADDLLIEDSTEVRLRCIESHQNIRFLASDIYIWNEYENTAYPGVNKYATSEIIKNNRNKNTTFKSGGFFIKNCFHEFLTTIPAHPNTVMIEKSLLAESGLFNCNLKRGQDVDLWRRLALIEDMFYLDRPTAVYRVNQEVHARINGNWYDYDLMSIDLLTGQTKSPEYLGALSALKHKIFIQKLYYNANQGNIKSSIATYFKCLITQPTSILNIRYFPQLIKVFIKHFR